MEINTEADTNIVMPIKQLRAERIRVLYQQVKSVLVGNFSVSLLLTVFLYTYTNNIWSLYWMLVVTGFTGVRYLLLRQYYQYERDEKEVIWWGWIFALTAFVSGCIWGATSLIFLETDNLVIMLFLLMTLTGITVGSSASLSNFASSYYAFAIPTILPYGYVLSSTGKAEFVVLSLMLLVFLMLQLVVAKKNQLTLDRSIVLRNENADLIKQLQIKKEKAELANAAKTRFLAAASHDLRQPLHAMNIFFDVLEERNKDTAQAEIVDKIKKSSISLENLLGSLLDISKLDAGVININIKAFKVQTLFDILYDEFKTITEEKGLDLHFVPSSLSLNSDIQIIERILRNLISNAVRYTKKGKVLIGCRRSEDTVRLCVYDTGIGIDNNKTEIIFEEFHQLNNDNRDRSKGLGLGLSIVKRLAELLGAKINLQSELNKGSVFSITCPRSLSVQTSEAKSISFGNYSKLAGKTIAIIEDEEEIRAALKLLLNGWGCGVIELTSINDVKEKVLQSNKPDLILSDYRLANRENGVGVINAIHEYYQDNQIPAIIITGDTDPDRIKEAKKSGYQILHKPVSGGKLRALLNSVLLSK